MPTINYLTRVEFDFGAIGNFPRSWNWPELSARDRDRSGPFPTWNGRQDQVRRTAFAGNGGLR